MSAAVSRIGAERNQKALSELALKPGNDSCADCKTRNPRWASHNLGIFICVNCASIHRKIGTHVSKVKSLTMDLWTKEQVENMRQVGNIKSNQKYNPDEVRNPPPTNMIDAERDSDLEKFIRDKYEFKRFVSRADIGRADISRPDRSAVVAAHLGPSRSASSVRSSASSSSFSRSQTLPPTKPSLTPATSAPAAPARAPTLPASAPVGTSMTRSVSQPVPPQTQLQPPQPPPGVWFDLASLQGSTGTSTLPLQYMSPTTSSPYNINPATGSSSMSASFTQGVSPNLGLASQGPGFGVNSSPVGPNVSGLSIATQSSQSPFSSGPSPFNPFTQMVAQQPSQAQLQPYHFPSNSPFGSLHSQQPSFPPQGQLPQIQQPQFSQPGTNPFFTASAQSQRMLSPQPQVPIQSTTPSPVPFTGSPYQQQTQSPFQQQPSFQQGVQAPYPPQPSQFGNVQPSGGAATGNPFTSWLTQPPNSYASAHVGQGSGQWGM